MKKTKFILTLSFTALTLLSTGIVTSAITSPNGNENQAFYTVPTKDGEKTYQVNDISAFENFEPNPEEDKLKEKVVQKYKKGDLKSLNVANISDIDLSLDEMNAKYEAEEEESNKNDLKAYEILSKYKGSKYARTTFITDYELDLTYMREMVTLIESNTLPKDESDVLHRYVSRRAYWITDENTAKEFEKWMLG